MPTQSKSKAQLIALAVLACNLGSFAGETLAQEQLVLRGIVRDFRPDHPDFAVNGTGGHFAGNVNYDLQSQIRPTLTQAGFGVGTQWRDKSNTPIAPHLYTVGSLPGINLASGYSPDNKSYSDTYDPDLWPYGGVNVGPAPQVNTGVTMPVISAPNMNNRIDKFEKQANGGSTTLSADVFCKDFIVKNHHTLIIDGNLTVYATESFKLQDYAELVILDGSSLTLYVEKVCTFQNQVKANMPTGDYARFTIYNLGTEPVLCQDQTNVNARVISPNGDLEVQNGSNFYGSVTARGVGLSNHAGLHIAGKASQCAGLMVADTAGAQGSGSSHITSENSFGQWFRTVPGVNAATRHDILLEDAGGGVYQYLDNAFTPIDGELYGNNAQAHNFYFTYEVPASFQYNACSDQYLAFEGNDDCWVYIDDKLVIDLGGIAPGTMQIIEVDRLNLTDGDTYSVRLFFAQRTGNLGRFNIRTNIALIPAPLAEMCVSAHYD